VRTQLIWNTFMRNREVVVAMEKVGFRSQKGRDAVATGGLPPGVRG
jgi:hypothetical protein